MGGEQAASVLAQIRKEAEAKKKKGETVREFSLAMIKIDICKC